jgi:hypothetical protein
MMLKKNAKCGYYLPRPGEWGMEIIQIHSIVDHTKFDYDNHSKRSESSTMKALASKKNPRVMLKIHLAKAFDSNG